MPSTKVITLGLMALFSIPALASNRVRGFDHCMPVSISTFEAERVQGENTSLGPKGVYATTTTGECVYVDASPDSAFAKEQPALHDEFIQAVGTLDATGSLFKSLEFLNGETDPSHAPNFTPRDVAMDAIARLKGRQANCKDLCNSSQTSSLTCNSCACKYRTTSCIGGVGQIAWCISYWYCQ